MDVIGIGAGVVDSLRDRPHLRKKVIAFNSSERTSRKDSSGELGFINTRSAAWWHLRERLDPDSPDDPILLPPDEELTGDLTAPKWWVTGSGKIQIEGKDELRKRLGRSPDVGDAVVMAFWLDARSRQVIAVSPFGQSQRSYWKQAAHYRPDAPPVDELEREFQAAHAQWLRLERRYLGRYIRWCAFGLVLVGAACALPFYSPVPWQWACALGGLLAVLTTVVGIYVVGDNEADTFLEAG